MGALATDAIDEAIEALEANDGALRPKRYTRGTATSSDMERSIGATQCLTLLLRQASSPWRATSGKYPRPSR